MLAIAPATADAAKRRHPVCQKHGSETVANTKHVRVYAVGNSDGGKNLYGCLRSNNRRQLLTRSADDDYVSSSDYGRVTIAGHFVAWEETSTDVSCKADCPPDYDPSSASLYLYDLKKPDIETIVGEVYGGLVLSRGGALVWTEAGADAVSVKAFDGGGARTLDNGKVDAYSLKLRDGVASWLNDGQPRSAQLSPRT